MDDRGRRVACACGRTGSQELRRRQAAGRYFVAVLAREGARGRYTLRRLSRTITRTTATLRGRRSAAVRPGDPVTLAVRVTPRLDGPVTIVVERFDPLAGSQFARRFALRAADGRAALGYVPPSVGRWRFHATFDGTRTASPSTAPTARVVVAERAERDGRGRLVGRVTALPA